MGVLESPVPFPQPAGCRAFSGAVQRVRLVCLLRGLHMTQ